MSLRNPTDEPLQARVTVRAEVYPSGTDYTRTATFVTYNNSINIAAGATGEPAAQTCETPGGVEFWRLSTHAHKQAVKTQITDGANSLFTSTDWAHPGDATFAAPNFYAFAPDAQNVARLTYVCTYDNPNPYAVKSGPSEATDEQCRAIGYFFPATKAKICFDGFGPFDV